MKEKLLQNGGGRDALKDYSMKVRSKAFDSLIYKYLQNSGISKEQSHSFELNNDKIIKLFKEAYQLVN